MSLSSCTRVYYPALHHPIHHPWVHHPGTPPCAAPPGPGTTLSCVLLLLWASWLPAGFPNPITGVPSSRDAGGITCRLDTACGYQTCQKPCSWKPGSLGSQESDLEPGLGSLGSQESGLESGLGSSWKPGIGPEAGLGAPGSLESGLESGSGGSWKPGIGPETGPGRLLEAWNRA